MSGRRVDYDSIAPTYNRRFENDQTTINQGTGRTQNNTRQALVQLVQEIEAGHILEVGCGTGHWLSGLAEDLSARIAQLQLYGLDLSVGMLSQASKRGTEIALIHATSEQLPFRNGYFDLVYCVNAIHHFWEPQKFIQEARRVLRPGGSLSIIGSDPHDHWDDWYVYQYFEGTYEADLERFPSWGNLVDWVLKAGFEGAKLELVEHIHNPKLGEEVLEDPFLDKNAISQLALLSESEYARGIERIYLALEEAKNLGRTVDFPCDIYMHMLVTRVAKEKLKR